MTQTDAMPPVVLGRCIRVGPDAATPLCPSCDAGPVQRDGAFLSVHGDRITRRWRCTSCGHRWSTRELYKPLRPGGRQ